MKTKKKNKNETIITENNCMRCYQIKNDEEFERI